MEDKIETAVCAVGERLLGWLTAVALPLWWDRGVDRISEGYFERLQTDATPIHEVRRCRVQSRQIYAFSVGSDLGWSGDAGAAIRTGLSFLTRAYTHPDGTLGMTASDDGMALDPTISIYNQAFGLLAMAQAHRCFPQEDHVFRARALRDHLRARYSHPLGGFEESSPPSLPLKSNPHMHMLEACLAWVELDDVRVDSGWRDLADTIAGLALGRLIDPQTGYLREYFAHDWTPMPGEEGRVVEPGHQFEWAWLLARWGLLRERADAVQAARKLAYLGEAHGVCRERNLCYGALRDDHTVLDAVARLWPQTERLKAGFLLSQIARSTDERQFWLERVLFAARGLEGFLQTPVNGLWWDKCLADGHFVVEPAPASTLYHIVCALMVLHEPWSESGAVQSIPSPASVERIQ
ncbi:AGE family epimerase/isomerase (plasmid) [Segnochrobactraceae bacterium EtOH-i3]